MDLKEFVSDTLVQICEGIKDAQVKTKEMGAYVSPMLTDKGTATTQGCGATGVSKVCFDVALEVVDETQSGDTSRHGAELKIFCARLSLDGKDESRSTGKESHVSRVSFEVPVKWPAVPLDKKLLGTGMQISPHVVNNPPSRSHGW